MEEQKSNAGQGLGIAGLVLGIFTVIFALLPCTFIFSLIIGLIAIILSSVGLSQAKKGNGKTGLPIGALIVSIFGFLVATLWGLFFAASIGGHMNSEKWGDFFDELEYKIEKNIETVEEETDDSYKITIEIDKEEKEMEKTLEELEAESHDKDTLKEE